MKNKSTYSLLLNADSEEKGRSIFEAAVYSLFVLCAAASFWSFASRPVTVPGQASTNGHSPAVIAKAVAEQPAFASRN
ncbi:MAG: hypothetical protein M3Y80_05935 [Verrucomicrobiota bacterium]|nr:hypothetical protein [Verrucomicrobiota bacterium]